MPLGGNWIIQDPLGTSVVDISGGEAHITLTAVRHDLHTANKDACRAVQNLIDDDDFDVVVELPTAFITNTNSVSQGIVAQVDANHFIRMGLGALIQTTWKTKLYFAEIDGASLIGTAIDIDLTGISFPYYIRLKRVGDVFEGFTSPDGTTWTSRGTITAALTIAQVGIFAGNASANPAYTLDFGQFLVDGEPTGIQVTAALVEKFRDTVSSSIDIRTEVEAVISEGGVGPSGTPGRDIVSCSMRVRDVSFPILKDRVLEVTTVEGTGSATLLGNVIGNKKFQDEYEIGIQFPYVIKHETLNESESGYGKLTSIDTLERTVVTASTNNGNLVNFSAGNKRVFVEVTSNVMDYIFSTIHGILNRLDAGGL